MKSNPLLARFSWALYDLANTIFSMNIISLYFVLWLTVDKGCGEVYYSLALGLSIFSAALLMPILGEICDRLKRRIPFLIAFTIGCVLFTALLGLGQGIFFALLFFGLANFCYQLAGVVYNSLLPQVSTPQTLGRTSGLGVSLGYIGTILGLVLVKPFLVSGGRQATFIPTAVLFLVFALPAFIFIKDRPHPYFPKAELRWANLFSRLLKALAQIRQDRNLSRFLISTFLCLNAVNTIVVFMGVYANRVMNFADTQLIFFMSVCTVFAIVGSYIFGHLTDRWGSKQTLNLVIKFWCLAIFLAGIATKRWMFWTVGPLAGVCLGATWVSLRTMLVDLVDQEQVGQMFGLFGLLHMLSFISGTLVWGMITTWIFAPLEVFRYRIAMASVFIFMFCGYLVFQKVWDPKQSP